MKFLGTVSSSAGLAGAVRLIRAGLSRAGLVGLVCLTAGTVRDASAETLALTHANVVHVRSGKILTDQTVVIDGRKIVSIGAAAAAPAAAKVLDLTGKHLVSGLIDAHTHIATLTTARTGVYLVPTYTTVVDLARPGGDYDVPALRLRGRHMLPRIGSAVQQALKLGVKIVTGADTTYGPASLTRISHEIEAFVELGMTPLQALQSATTVAAELLQ